ncbi:MAG: hypothetical protein K9J12_16255 [Melioribacteraceae bacterium]|nr:hypothetical protein [Melioribacteraceae bacterium]MCF8263995.1 hypothetical protein [Melioribacteraceae bacterium]MCF8430752.1 hypothetical protein [Melioribacteraceae bacterium]
MKKLTISILLLLLFSASIYSQKTDEVYLKSTTLLFYENLSGRDWDSIPEYFTSGAKLSLIRINPQTQKEVVESLTPMQFVKRSKDVLAKLSIFEEEVLESKFEVSKNLAHGWIKYKARAGNEGSVFEWTGIDAFTWIKVNSEWKIQNVVSNKE